MICTFMICTSMICTSMICTSMIISRWILVRIRNISNKNLWHVTTHILRSVKSPPRTSCGLWHNVERYGTARQATDDNIIWRVRFAYWINKARETHSEYAVLTAFPPQQRLHECVSVLGNTDTAVGVWTERHHWQSNFTELPAPSV